MKDIRVNFLDFRMRVYVFQFLGRNLETKIRVLIFCKNTVIAAPMIASIAMFPQYK